MSCNSGTKGVAVTYIARGKEEREFAETKKGIGADIDPLPGKETLGKKDDPLGAMVQWVAEFRTRRSQVRSE